MSEALIRSYYDAFNRRDWDGMVGLLTDDVVHDVNQGPREVGRATFRAFLGRMEAAYREQLRDLVVMVAPAGDCGAAKLVIDGEYLAADAGLPAARGQRYSLPIGAFFGFRDGKIARVTNYYNVQDWLRQVE